MLLATAERPQCSQVQPFSCTRTATGVQQVPRTFAYAGLSSCCVASASWCCPELKRERSLSALPVKIERVQREKQRPMRGNYFTSQAKPSQANARRDYPRGGASRCALDRRGPEKCANRALDELS